MTDIEFPQAWTQLTEIIRSHNRFWISSHIRPDGDAVGSSLALKRLLERMGKDVLWVLDEKLSRTFDLFHQDGELSILQTDPSIYADREIVMMLDAGDWYRLGKTGEMMRAHPGRKVCIDHHIPQTPFEGLRILDTTAPSTSVLIYRYIQFLQMDFDLSLAEPIYLGLIVDTQNFHLPNTTEEAHYIAAACLHAGVDPPRVYEPVFGATGFSRIRLMSEALKTLELHCNGKVGMMYTTQAMFQEANADLWEDDGFVDFVRSVEEVRIGVYLREEKNGDVKVSWRAKGGNNVVQSAQRFGGGGHLRAAGASIEGSLTDVKRMVLDDLAERDARGEIS